MIFKQRGIALLQALLITLVITVMAIGFSYNARDQVEIASDFVSRIEADLKLDSAKAEIMYWLSVENVSRFPLALSLPKGFNLYGKPFTIAEGVSIEIQDVAGLYPVNLFNRTTDTRWLNAIGLSNSLVEKAASELTKHKKQISNKNGWANNNDVKRNLQFLKHEFKLLGVPADIADIMASTATIYPTTYLNPLTMPDKLLPLLFEPEAVTGILEQREKGELTASNLRQVTGIYDYDNFFFDIQTYPMGIYKVNIHSVVNQIEVTRTLDLMLQPRVKPFVFLLQERNI
ncbi:hypothetical protein [Shewanella donghaensis]|uniref:hypothetical protein n=1 Tax=Shewanella donghaensis TaxID=238836 RepID=UPI0011835140|nr:hypothetical protein [Shewanella donghaensis]